MSTYSVNAVKKIRGHDGNGYSCNLLKDGKKVADVLDDGWGGGLRIDWLGSEKALVTVRRYDNTVYSYDGNKEESAFAEYVMSLPKISASENFPEINTSMDIVIDDLVNDVLIEKKVTSDLKKNVVVQTKDNKFLNFKITPQHTVEKIKEYALKKYPSSKIMNDLNVKDVIKVYTMNNLIA